jgi:hypothetical protein
LPCIFFLSIGGFLGLLAGFIAAFSHNRLFAWITCISALAIVALSIVFASAFLCCRTRGVPLTDPMYFGRLHVSNIALYGAAFIVCSVEALLFIAKIGKRSRHETLSSNKWDVMRQSFKHGLMRRCSRETEDIVVKSKSIVKA